MTTEGTVKSLIKSKHLTWVKNIILEPTDGTRRISKQAQLFTGGIDSTIGHYEGTHNSAPESSRRIASLYEVVRELELQDIILGLQIDLDRMTINQDQLIQLIENHQELLGLDTHAIFAVMEIDGDYFLLQVRNDLGGPKVSMADFRLQKVECEARYTMRVLLLQPSPGS